MEIASSERSHSFHSLAFLIGAVLAFSSDILVLFFDEFEGLVKGTTEFILNLDDSCANPFRRNLSEFIPLCTLGVRTKAGCANQ